MIGKACHIAGWLRAICGMGVVYFCLVLPGTAVGEEPRLSQGVHEQLVEVQELIQSERPQKALTQLRALATNTELSPYEAALVQQTLGYAHAGLEQYDQAVTAFQKSLAGEALQPDNAQIVRYNLAQMLIITERYEEGAHILEKWLANEENPSPQAHVSLAQAYMHLKRYAPAEQHIRKAIGETTTFHESWYQLLVVVQIEQKKFSQAASTLQQLLGQYPEKKTYWQQLSQIYGQEEKHKRAVSTLAMAYKLGILNEREALQVVQYYLHLGLPYKAADLLADGLKKKIVQDADANRALLVTCLLHARESQRALDVLEQSAQSTQTGRVDLQRAEILVQLERWPEVATTVSEGLRKGGLANTGKAFMLLGIAEYRSGKLDESKAAFSEAAAHKPSAKQARQWLRLIEQESAKQQ